MPHHLEKNRAGTSPRRRWCSHLWHEWSTTGRQAIAQAFAHPAPKNWDASHVTAAWLGHSTILINFFGVTILTDPVLSRRIGIRFPGFTVGPKRLTAPAVSFAELPPIRLVLLSHAHFDHLDMRTLRRFHADTAVVTASRTLDLLRRTPFRDITELAWGERATVESPAGALEVTAFRVNHWGARLRRDTFRGYNGYILERHGRRIIFAGDTAYTRSFAALRDDRRYDLAIMAIGAYDPWIRAHATPEQVVEMCDAAGVNYILPVHHQTFRLSFEPFREPIERLEQALRAAPQRIALREIGETFVLPR